MVSADGPPITPPSTHSRSAAAADRPTWGRSKSLAQLAACCRQLAVHSSKHISGLQGTQSCLQEVAKQAPGNAGTTSAWTLPRPKTPPPKPLAKQVCTVPQPTSSQNRQLLIAEYFWANDSDQVLWLLLNVCAGRTSRRRAGYEEAVQTEGEGRGELRV